MASELFKEAIADARAVRASALANAKAALEEAFTPRLQSMLGAKLREELDDESLSSGVENPQTDSLHGGGTDSFPGEQSDSFQESTDVTSEEIDEILKELGGSDLEEDAKITSGGKAQGQNNDGYPNATIPKAKNVPVTKNVGSIKEDAKITAGGKSQGQNNDGYPNATIPKAKNVPVTKNVGKLNEDGEEDPSIPAAPTAGEIDPAASATSIDPTAGAVKTVEAPVMVVAPGQAPAAPTSPEGSEEPVGGEPESTDAGLDELLAELGRDNEEIDLNELLNGLNEESEEKEESDESELCEVKKQFADAVKTVEFLRSQLNEVNLLNAKLLYTNKLFKARAFDNHQKMKIIEAFDLTKSIREVKLTYSNLSEAFNLSKVKTPMKKSTIAEGFASQSIGTTKPAASIVAAPVNEMASRFQKLAGIKK